MSVKRCKWLAAALLILAFLPRSAGAQSPDLVSALARYSELYAAGRFEEALPLADEALRLGLAE